MLEGNDRLVAEFERLGDFGDERTVAGDPLNWISTRLREAGNIVAGEGHTCSARLVDRLLFALADRAEVMEKDGIDLLRDEDFGMIFANATILAAGIVEEYNP